MLGASARPCDAAEALPPGALVRLKPASRPLHDVAASPDGATVATATAMGDVQLWRASDGQRTFTLAAETPATSIEFSADGTRLVAVYTDGTVRLWDVRGGAVVARLMVHPRATIAAALSPDGRLLAGGGADGSVHLVDGETGNRLRSFAPARDAGLPPPAVRALAFSPDGAALVSAHDAHAGARVWDPREGRELAHLLAGGPSVESVVFSPDGATLATGPSMLLWETATWRRRGKLLHRGPRLVLGGFSADGRGLWTGVGNELWRWDLASGLRVASFTGHRGEVTAVAPFARADRVVSAGDDGAAIVWDAAPQTEPVTPAPAPADWRPEGLWAALAAEDAAAAYEAMWAFVAHPKEAVPYLRNRIPRRDGADAQRVRALLAQLDDERFAVRERAVRELAAVGDAAEPLLREHLSKTRSPEVAQRLEVLLESVKQSAADAEMIRALRAVEVLERIATPEARAALEELAGGVAGMRLKARAQAALHRLGA